ncbi:MULTISPECIES: hypothetical protein [Rhizobium]|uniref:hypothetical protein n=1 Tax=Rhizobium TaxID=379 RepID=UPI0010317058|nr:MULTISPECIES: hypothetical protein [Rhizobium]TBF24884.1 hypothetical protein ELG88_33805 [Rhizobium leguminosarum]WSH48600.1 hypothetical protein U8P77_35370 [Rhizobium johnstonii]
MQIAARRISSIFAIMIFILAMSGCMSIVAPYDSTFDQYLNKFSEDTAKFTAAAKTGGPERIYKSRETVEYYAASYNVLDRLSQRAAKTRAPAPCPGSKGLLAFSQFPSSVSPLPQDYQSFDCREYQLYGVRYYLDQLNYGHRNDGILKPGEAQNYGGQLQNAILGAISTFALTK